MKKSTVFISIILLLILSNSSYSKFHWQHISGEVNDVFLIDTLNFYIVGDDGKILRSYDGGNKWVWQESFIRLSFYSVCFYDINYGAVAADSGYVLLTTNSGRTWRSVKAGKTKLNCIKIIDKNVLIAAGDSGLIYYSYDKGNNWELRYSNDTTNFRNIKFVDDKIAYVVGDHNFVLKTEDQGATWSKLFPYHKNFMLQGIDFCDKEHGVVGGFDSTAKLPITYCTTNGGASWDTVKFDFWSDWLRIKMFDKNKVILFSIHGGITKTDDFFKTYNNEYPTTKDYIDLDPQPVWLRSVSTLENGVIFCIGLFNLFSRSADSGKSYKIFRRFDLTKLPRYRYMSGMVFLNDTETLFYGENGFIFKSFDGGTTFDYVYPKDTANYVLYFYGSNLYGHHFKNSKEGFLIGKRQLQNYHDFSTAFTIYTSDGGLNWVKDDKISAHSMCFPEQDIGYAVGDSLFWWTDDEGESWQSKKIFPGSSMMNFWELDFKSKDIGFIWGRQLNYNKTDTVNFPYGSAYRVLKTTNGGETFDTIATIGNSRLTVQNAYFVDEKKAFMFGTGFDMLVTNDGGVNWNWINIDSNKHIVVSMRFLDADLGIAGGSHDTVLITRDGGKTWNFDRIVATSIISRYSSQFENIAVKNKDTVYLFGYTRLIRGVWFPDSVNSSQDINLEQSKEVLSISPNPSPDFIEISYSPLEKGARGLSDEIRIYNVFGEEVNLTPALSMLGEGENNPLNPPLLRGNLKIDVSPLSPGVYFVRVGGRVGRFVKI